MICARFLASAIPTTMTAAECAIVTQCLGSRCSQWVPEIAGSPAAPTGQGWCADNVHAPSRADPAKEKS